MNDKSTNHHIYSNVETTRSIARVEGRLKFLLNHESLPGYFATVIQQCMDDLETAHRTHEQTLSHQKQERARIMSDAIYNKSPLQVN